MNQSVVNWFANDELFFKECREGHKWQVHVGEFFASQGLPVQIPELTFRGNPNVLDYTDADAKLWAEARQKSEMARVEYVNTKDLLVCGKVIEVKSRRLKFTCPSDYPFSMIFVDTVSGYDQKDPKPVMYVCVSQETGKMICTLTRNSHLWSKTKTFDKVRKIWVVNYVASWTLWHPISVAVNAFKSFHENPVAV